MWLLGRTIGCYSDRVDAPVAVYRDVEDAKRDCGMARDAVNAAEKAWREHPHTINRSKVVGTGKRERRALVAGILREGLEGIDDEASMQAGYFSPHEGWDYWVLEMEVR